MCQQTFFILETNEELSFAFETLKTNSQSLKGLEDSNVCQNVCGFNSPFVLFFSVINLGKYELINSRWQVLFSGVIALADWYSSTFFLKKQTMSAPPADLCNGFKQSYICHLRCMIILCTDQHFVKWEWHNNIARHIWAPQYPIAVFLHFMRTYALYLFPEGFSNVCVVFTDIACNHNSIFR